MPLNENFLQELKYKTDIEDIISTYVTLRKRGNTSVGLCPFIMKRHRHLLYITYAIILLLWLRRRR